MRRTKPAKKIQSQSNKKWWIGMEFLPGRFGLVKGPYISADQVSHVKVDHHHCIIMIYKGKAFLTHRKTSGKWQRTERKRIALGQKGKRRSGRKG